MHVGKRPRGALWAPSAAIRRSAEDKNQLSPHFLFVLLFCFVSLPLRQLFLLHALLLVLRLRLHRLVVFNDPGPATM